MAPSPVSARPGSLEADWNVCEVDHLTSEARQPGAGGGCVKQSNTSERLCTAGGQVLLADGAPKIDRPVVVEALQDGLDPAVIARLTDVMLGLRRQWLASCAESWGGICAISESPGADLEERIATTVRFGFSQFSQFLTGIEVLALQLHELAGVREETLLGLEQKVIGLDELRALFRSVPHVDGSADQILGASDCRDRRGGEAGDRSEIHEQVTSGEGGELPSCQYSKTDAPSF